MQILIDDPLKAGQTQLCPKFEYTEEVARDKRLRVCVCRQMIRRSRDKNIRTLGHSRERHFISSILFTSSPPATLVELYMNSNALLLYSLHFWIKDIRAPASSASPEYQILFP